MSKLSSMTGFARSSASFEDTIWTWEARCVNGRGLDMRIRLPFGFESIEPEIRKAYNKAFSRGNFQISLTFGKRGSQSSYEINQDWLDRLKLLAPDQDMASLLQVEGVVVQRQPYSDDRPELVQAILKSGSETISKLRDARQVEGKALVRLLEDAIDGIDSLVSQARSHAHTQPETIQANFMAKFKELTGENIDPDRLATEASILALKADIREELDRLDAHISLARNHLKKGSPIGRKLDFLAQEFNREINTICSKSASSELTSLGLEMKAINEQFREQSANVE